jgi:methyl-accepting chemotaxis protein
MTDMNSPLRKHLFVDRTFQIKFILYFSLLVVIGTVLFSLAAYLILDNQMGNSLFSAHVAMKRTGELLRPTLLSLSLAFVIILGVASVIITLLVSHKISGPLFAMVRYLKMISEGRLNFEAKLRTNDQTAALADCLTDTIRVLNGRITLIKENAAGLAKKVAELDSLMGQKGSGQPEILRTVSDLKEQTRIIEERLGFFETNR